MATGTVKVGEFEFDPATGTLTGPAGFMRSADYAGWLARFKGGNDPVFRVGMGCPPGPGAIFCRTGAVAQPGGRDAGVGADLLRRLAWHGSVQPREGSLTDERVPSAPQTAKLVRARR